MAIALHYVRFWGQSGHHAKLRECPLMTQSGHRVTYFAAMQSTVRSVMGSPIFISAVPTHPIRIGTLCPHDGQVSTPEQKARVKAVAFSFTEPAAFSMASSDTS